MVAADFLPFMTLQAYSLRERVSSRTFFLAATKEETCPTDALRAASISLYFYFAVGLLAASAVSLTPPLPVACALAAWALWSVRTPRSSKLLWPICWQRSFDGRPGISGFIGCRAWSRTRSPIGFQSSAAELYESDQSGISATAFAASCFRCDR